MRDSFRLLKRKRVDVAVFLSAIIITLLFSGNPASARTKMVTLPERERIFIHLDNPDFILVEEERVVTLQKGTNRIDFSWQGVNLDPGSIQLFILEHTDEVRLINYQYPPGENAIVAQLYSEIPVEERVRITYIISGVSRESSYVAIAENDERTMELRAYTKVTNTSGEEFENAEIFAGYGEYFKKSIRNGEAKKVLSFKAMNLPVRKEFEWDSARMPHDPDTAGKNAGIPMYYVIKNDKDSKLGLRPLLYGKARIFQKDKNGTTVFLGEDWGKFTAAGDEMKLYLGDSRDITVRRRLMDRKKTNVRRNYKNEVILHDETELYRYEIKNFKKEPVSLRIIDHFKGYWEIPETDIKFEKKDAETVEFKLDIPGSRDGKPETKIFNFQLVKKNIR